jgi:hypothetical protein
MAISLLGRPGRQETPARTRTECRKDASHGYGLHAIRIVQM